MLLSIVLITLLILISIAIPLLVVGGITFFKRLNEIKQLMEDIQTPNMDSVTMAIDAMADSNRRWMGGTGGQINQFYEMVKERLENILKATDDETKETKVSEETTGITAYNIKITHIKPGKKLSVINVIRRHTGLGLIEAKDLLESWPVTAVYHATEDSAKKIVNEIHEAGGESVLEQVTLKGLLG